MTTTDAPQGVTYDHLFRWLEQVSDDRELPPVATQVAVLLARDFAEKGGSTSRTNPDIASAMRVGQSTTWRALGAMRRRGHLLAEGVRGVTTFYCPLLKGAM